ncbi:hypothetical protein AL036_07125 [Salipiger aestuarii]|uniref:dUTP diphosphatase n=1 Tax=Salipiger aestuarii TaxID=568098 RepID=UPI00123A8062|nr:dUTP diphosphatase [Salipiger aestuarii]KAA8608430.1 hypothetical protein AL036_07125 [Salipiger aestuarii]
MLEIRKLCPTAVLPRRATKGSAGYDLSACLRDENGTPRCDFAATGAVIYPGTRAMVPLGISIALPPETYGRIGPRSGLAVRHCIDTAAGIVDLDYRGELHAVLVNHGTAPYVVEHGARIAQLVIERIALPDVVEVEALGDTARGGGGFGSSGV